MSVRLSVLIAAIASGAILVAPMPVLACRGDCDHARSPAAAKPSKQSADGKATPEDSVSATCNCEGPSDCTCKKGQCKCKKCSKHHASLEAKKT
jgi:hypothetical protein